MNEDLKYKRIVQAIQETPWAILPGTLAVILDLIAFRASGGKLTDDEIQARVGSRTARRDAHQQGAVAVLPLYGVIVPRADLFSEMSGATSMQRFQQDFRAALNDPDVGSIVIDVDSPGGSTAMVPEMAREIRAARGRKPITAVANTLCASAAYYIAAQADEIVATPSSMLGSIGVFHVHQDISQMQEKLGVKTTLTSAGEFKTEGNPFEPLTDEAKAAIQALVDETYGMFVQDVAKGRGRSVADVRKGFGRGRVVTASQAVKEGMADRVDTLDGAIVAAARGSSGMRAGGFGSRTLQVQLMDGEAVVPLRALLNGAYEPEPYRQEADETVECPECECMNEPDARYCDQCGTKLEGRDDVEAEPADDPSAAAAAELLAGPIKYVKTDVVDTTWDGPAEEAKIPNDAGEKTLRKMYAWVDDDADPDTKAAYAMPHHRVVDGEPEAAVVSACRNGLARLEGSRIPESDYDGVKAHLQHHIDDFNASQKSSKASAPDVARLLSRPAVREAFRPRA